MKAAVIDASVAAKWVIAEDHSDRAAALLDCEQLHAPDHWLAEAVNFVWARAFRGELDAGDAAERAQALTQAPVIGAALPGLMPRAFEIATARSVTVYDALYVSLAEKLGLPLVTADRKLVRALAAGGTSVIWIGARTASTKTVSVSCT